MRELKLEVTPDMAGRTVKSLLGREFHMAPSLISRLKMREDGICLNGVRVRTNTVCSAGDILTADVSDVSPSNSAEPAGFSLEIVYEDDDLAIINKPAGIAVHGSRGGSPTVAGALASMWGSGAAFHPVSRLDRGTSGLMTAAKSAYIHDRLRRMLHTESFRREYIAVAEGYFSQDSGSIELPISAVSADGGRRFAAADGLPSRTDYSVIARGGGMTVLRVLPLTGRTHQIRVHFSAIGHPLCGDILYGGGSGLIQRPALHSAGIFLLQPVTGAEIRVSAPLPADMNALVLSVSGHA